MKLYWKDIESDEGAWAGLALECHEDDGGLRKPALHIESGANGRIRLLHHCRGGGAAVPRFWASVGIYYEGVHLLRSDIDAPASIAPSTLNSAVVDHHARLPAEQRLASWSRVFVRALADGPGCILHAGEWMLLAISPQPPDKWRFTPPSTRQFGDWIIKGARDALRDSPIHYVDWYTSGSSEVLSLHRPPDADDGRVRWWRKKAREDALPPVLLWYVACLDAYLILDGHSRLQAAILEDRPPEFLVAYSFDYLRIPTTSPERRAAVLESVERNLEQTKNASARRKELDTKAFNKLLIATFDDRPMRTQRSYGWPNPRLEAQWLQEVRERLESLGESDRLEEFVAR